ncbi:MAG: DUF1501 domain-containing protein [Burkholderiales bacterium]|nr:DUF1501 domain-containing protein [Burkholderiales bacterium]
MSRPSELTTTERRAFLRHVGSLATLGAGAPLALNLAALGNVAAQVPGSDYKALVCVFLAGGNDSFNTVLATDGAPWAAYVATRKQAPTPIALRSVGTAPNGTAAAGTPDRLGGVLGLTSVTPGGPGLALHPLLAGLAQRYNTSRKLALVANVGPLLAPTTKAQATASNTVGVLPPKLYSHNDQQSVWQAMSPEGASKGWGGRLADAVVGAGGVNSQAMFTAISLSGSSIWLNGDIVRPYMVGTGGVVRIGSGSRLFGSTAAFTAMREVMGTSRGGHVLEADHAAVVKRSVDAEALLATAVQPAGTAPWGTPANNYSQSTDPLLQYTSASSPGTLRGNSLARQLQMVARLIAARSTLGMRRQVFFVQLGGFDTHDQQNGRHADLMAQLDQALAYFDTTLLSLGVAPQVTTFTASDFGRTFTSNGDGTDHGWGSHQFVLGGAVNGGALYGAWPSLSQRNPTSNKFDASPDQLGNGVLLPTTSVDQYAATLARWFGASDTQIATLLPNLARFDPASRNLGFLS